VDAAFGLTFDDPIAGVSGDIALRDLTYAFEGSLDVFANGVGPFGLRGPLDWTQVRGTLDIRTDIGLEGTIPAPPVPSSDGFLFSSTSQFAEISPGVYEVVLPFGFTVMAFDLPGPVTSLATSMSFSGELVATTDAPEPGFGLALALGAGLLSRLRRTRRLR
jgi:hypothetical protein